MWFCFGNVLAHRASPNPSERQLRSAVPDTVLPDRRGAALPTVLVSAPAPVEPPLCLVRVSELGHYFPLLASVVFTASKMKDSAFTCCLEKKKNPNVLLSFIHSFEVIIAITVSCAFFPNHNDLGLTEYGRRDGTVSSSRQFCEANGSNLNRFLVSEISSVHRMISGSTQFPTWRLGSRSTSWSPLPYRGRRCECGQ